MKQLIKRHVGLIIMLIIAIVFPVCLSNQAKLSMRIIVTGIAIDKCEDGYEATAQIVKTTSNTESPGVGAEVDYISDKAETISFALANLMYKSGKVSAFSHTNFIILGDSILDEDVTNCLDIFMRDRLVKNSALILFAKGKGSDEIKKTKNMELSVGLGLQKVFSFKQEDCDGLMMTVLDFINDSISYGKTSVAGVLELTNQSSSSEASDSNSTESKSGESSESSNSSSLSSKSGSGESGSSTESGSSGGGESSGGNSDKNSKVYFKTNTPLYFFVNGKIAYKITNNEEMIAYLLFYPKTKKCYLEIDKIDSESLKDSKISINIKDKKLTKKVRFENNIPCLDLKLTITNCEINEIVSNKKARVINPEEYENIKKAIKEKLTSTISSIYESAINANADIFGAYKYAYKFKYNQLNKYYNNEKDFLQNLKLNVEIVVKNLDS